jgi:hypothetical protein
MMDTLDIRYFTDGAFDPIAVVAGLIQTAIYADFGYIVSVCLFLGGLQMAQHILLTGSMSQSECDFRL